MKRAYVELKAGDALFSTAVSFSARSSLISCYNGAFNKACNGASLSHFTPIEMVPEEALLEWDRDIVADVDFVGKEHVHKAEI